MTALSSILVWRIPWTEEPGVLQSMGLKRVRHDWATNTQSNSVCFCSVPKSRLNLCDCMDYSMPGFPVLCYLLEFAQSKTVPGFSSGLDGKESACNAGDLSSIPGSGRFPGEGNGTQLQYSCLENSMDRGAWWATVHGAAKESDRTQQLNNIYIYIYH